MLLAQLLIFTLFDTSYEKCGKQNEVLTGYALRPEDACGKLVEKSVLPIARPFLLKNFVQPESNVFHKLRANFPQVFPQLN
jgi:hypothetical protein